VETGDGGAAVAGLLLATQIKPLDVARRSENTSHKRAWRGPKMGDVRIARSIDATPRSIARRMT